jgi:hypothetical protein
VKFPIQSSIPTSDTGGGAVKAAENKKSTGREQLEEEKEEEKTDAYWENRRKELETQIRPEIIPELDSIRKALLSFGSLRGGMR